MKRRRNASISRNLQRRNSHIIKCSRKTVGRCYKIIPKAQTIAVEFDEYPKETPTVDPNPINIEGD